MNIRHVNACVDYYTATVTSALALIVVSIVVAFSFFGSGYDAFFLPDGRSLFLNPIGTSQWVFCLLHLPVIGLLVLAWVIQQHYTNEYDYLTTYYKR